VLQGVAVCVAGCCSLCCRVLQSVLQGVAVCVAVRDSVLLWRSSTRNPTWFEKRSVPQSRTFPSFADTDTLNSVAPMIRPYQVSSPKEPYGFVRKETWIFKEPTNGCRATQDTRYTKNTRHSWDTLTFFLKRAQRLAHLKKRH